MRHLRPPPHGFPSPSSAPHIPYWEHWAEEPPSTHVKLQTPCLGHFNSQPKRKHLALEPQSLPVTLPERQVTCLEREKKKSHLATLLLWVFFLCKRHKTSLPSPTFQHRDGPAMPTGGSAELSPHAHRGARSGGGGRGVT